MGGATMSTYQKQDSATKELSEQDKKIFELIEIAENKLLWQILDRLTRKVKAIADAQTRYRQNSVITTYLKRRQLVILAQREYALQKLRKQEGYKT